MVKELWISNGNVFPEFGIQTEEGVKLLNEVLGDENIGYISFLSDDVINNLLSSPLYPKIVEEAKKVMDTLKSSGIEQELKGVKLHKDYIFVLENGENINKEDGPIISLEYSIGLDDSVETFDPNEDDEEQFKNYLESKGFIIKDQCNNEIGTFIID
jgi:hypothetical protein